MYMEWIKENWLKLIVALTLIIISSILFYYYIFFIPAKETETARAIEETRYWDVQVVETQEMIETTQSVLDSAYSTRDGMKDWLDGTYVYMNDPSYSKVVGTVKIVETYVDTLKLYTDSLIDLLAVENEKMTYIRNRDQEGFDSVISAEASIREEVARLGNEVQQLMEQIERSKSQAVKEIYQ